MMLGFLLARMGVDVVVLEKHADFRRDSSLVRKETAAFATVPFQCRRALGYCLPRGNGVAVYWQVPLWKIRNGK